MGESERIVSIDEHTAIISEVSTCSSLSFKIRPLGQCSHSKAENNVTRCTRYYLMLPDSSAYEPKNPAFSEALSGGPGLYRTVDPKNYRK